MKKIGCFLSLISFFRLITGSDFSDIHHVRVDRRDRINGEIHVSLDLGRSLSPEEIITFHSQVIANRTILVVSIDNKDLMFIVPDADMFDYSHICMYGYEPNANTVQIVIPKL